MQSCTHHRLTLKEGPKVKSDNIRRFPAHDILHVCFTLQTSRINNKRVIKHFQVWLSLFDLARELKVKSDNTRRFLAHDFL